MIWNYLFEKHNFVVKRMCCDTPPFIPVHVCITHICSYRPSSFTHVYGFHTPDDRSHIRVVHGHEAILVHATQRAYMNLNTTDTYSHRVCDVLRISLNYIKNSNRTDSGRSSSSRYFLSEFCFVRVECLADGCRWVFIYVVNRCTQ